MLSLRFLLFIDRRVIRIVECTLFIIFIGFYFLWVSKKVCIVAEITHECVLLWNKSLSYFIWHWSYLLAWRSEIWLHNSARTCNCRFRSSIYWTCSFITVFIIFMVLLNIFLQSVLVYLIWSTYHSLHNLFLYFIFFKFMRFVILNILIIF